MSFEQMAGFMAGKQSLESEQELQQVQSLKKVLDEIFSIQISQKKLTHEQNKSQEQEMKAQQKEQKLNADLISKMMTAQPGQPVVGNGKIIDQFAPPIEPEAQGLPMLDMQGISI